MPPILSEILEKAMKCYLQLKCKHLYVYNIVKEVPK